MDGVRQALARNKTQWKEDMFGTLKVARQQLSIYHAEVTPTTDIFIISALILNPFKKLQSLRKRDKGMHIHPEDKPSNTSQYQQALLKDIGFE
jgi:hypothetical protein